MEEIVPFLYQNKNHLNVSLPEDWTECDGVEQGGWWLEPDTSDRVRLFDPTLAPLIDTTDE